MARLNEPSSDTLFMAPDAGDLVHACSCNAISHADKPLTTLAASAHCGSPLPQLLSVSCNLVADARCCAVNALRCCSAPQCILGSHEMADASHEHDALPSYGQNGRDLILKVTSQPGVMASNAPIVEPHPHNPGGVTTRHCLNVTKLLLDEMCQVVTLHIGCSRARVQGRQEGQGAESCCTASARLRR